MFQISVQVISTPTRHNTLEFWVLRLKSRGCEYSFQFYEGKAGLLNATSNLFIRTSLFVNDLFRSLFQSPENRVIADDVWNSFFSESKHSCKTTSVKFQSRSIEHYCPLSMFSLRLIFFYPILYIILRNTFNIFQYCYKPIY